MSFLHECIVFHLVYVHIMFSVRQQGNGTTRRHVSVPVSTEPVTGARQRPPDREDVP